MSSYRNRKLACIDIGTNSVQLLVAQRNQEGQLLILSDELQTPRLGEGLRHTGEISQARTLPNKRSALFACWFS